MKNTIVFTESLYVFNFVFFFLVLFFFLSGGTSPYYFGTTSLWCITKGKRGAPSRSTWSLTHRFIYYKSFFFEFLGKNLLNVMILPITIYFPKSLSGEIEGEREGIQRNDFFP